MIYNSPVQSFQQVPLILQSQRLHTSRASKIIDDFVAPKKEVKTDIMFHEKTNVLDELGMK